MMAVLLLFREKKSTVSIMSSNRESSEEIMKPASQSNARNQAPSIIGMIGLICSVFDLISITILAVLIVSEGEAFTWGVEPSIFYAGIILGAIGVAFGIIGAIKAKEKSAFIVAIVAGCIAIAITSLI